MTPWLWDGSHFPNRVTAAFADLYCEPAERGLAAGAARYGLALRGWNVRAEGGFVIMRTLEGISPDDVEVREAFAREALRTRRWISDAERWRTQERPRAVSAAAELSSVDLGALDNAGLARHLERAASIVSSGVARHFELHMADMLPLGRLLLAASAEGVPTSEVLERTVGDSHSRLPLAMEGWNVVGRLDIDAPTVAELQLSRTADLSRREPAPAVGFDHPGLDSLLDDVRRTFWVRDDNATLLLSAPVGLLRLAFLEAGRRLDVEALEATVSELAGLLGGSSRPTPMELRGRADQRRARAEVELPELDHAADDSGGVPGPNSKALTEALVAYDALYEAERPFGIGERCVEGRAVVATTPDQAVNRLTPESVLVVRTTAPAFDPVLALVAAVVCELGGPLCHAAIAARELGVTTVVGATGVTARIPDGALVEVDPTAATVTVRLG